MIISHNLNGNGYLINNEIWFDISSDLPVAYFRIFLQNLANGKISSTFTAYTQTNSARVNLQSIIKSLFDVPNGNDNNSASFKITITASDGTSINFNKSFIRGGKRTTAINQTIQNNQRLRISETIPIWQGLPISESYLNTNYSISSIPLANITDVDYRRGKGCNNIYFKFLNQKGGYSFWMFESYSEKETARNNGNVIGGNGQLIDLGNDSNSDLQVYSKIPKEYKQYAKDFIVSPDVYVWQEAIWKKVTTKNNSIEVDNIKKVYTVNFNLDLNYRFNPTLLWSN
jgi:hypothetical protein